MKNEEVKCPCNDGAGLVKNHIDKCKYCQIKRMPDINYTPPSQTKEVKCTCGYEKDNGHAPICPLYKPIDFSKFTPPSEQQPMEDWEKEFDNKFMGEEEYYEFTHKPDVYWKKQKDFIKNLLSTQKREFTRSEIVRIKSCGRDEAVVDCEKKLEAQQKDFDARVEGFIKEAEKKPKKGYDGSNLESANDFYGINAQSWAEIVRLEDGIEQGKSEVVALAKQTLQITKEK